MTMHEVCARLGLTKKAVRYYISEGLIAPRRLENGYADFSEADCEALERIALLRRLDLPLSEIRALIAGGSAEAALERLDRQIEREQTALGLLREFSRTRDYAQLRAALDREAQRRTIAERLESAFPGGFGRMAALMFAPYLNQPIETDDQRAAYDEIIAFLDGAPAIDPALIDEMQRTFAPIDAETAEKCAVPRKAPPPTHRTGLKRTRSLSASTPPLSSRPPIAPRPPEKSRTISGRSARKAATTTCLFPRCAGSVRPTTHTSAG